MQNFGLQPSSHTYDGFVRAIVSERGFSGGMEIVSYIGLLHRFLQKTDLAFGQCTSSFYFIFNL